MACSTSNLSLSALLLLLLSFTKFAASDEKINKHILQLEQSKVMTRQVCLILQIGIKGGREKEIIIERLHGKDVNGGQVYTDTVVPCIDQLHTYMPSAM